MVEPVGEDEDPFAADGARDAPEDDRWGVRRTEARARAGEVYDRTARLARLNMGAQGASGFFGMGVNLAVDVAAIPFYARHWNAIRGIYGKGAISVDAASAYLQPNVGFIVEDLVFDKALGSVPVAGIYFNAAFAKALTWRLGAWFGMLCALGDGREGAEGDVSEILTRSSLQLTREMFAASSGSLRTLRFPTPERERFVGFVAAMDGLTRAEAEDRVQRALDALAGRPG